MTTDINALFPSNYLKASDIGDNKPVAIIDTVEVEKLGQGDEQETKPVLYFQGKDKGLVLNKTNASALQTLFGPDYSKWSGQKIRLFVADVAFKGQMTRAIRISLEKIASAVAAKPVPAPVQDMADDDVPF